MVDNSLNNKTSGTSVNSGRESEMKNRRIRRFLMGFLLLILLVILLLTGALWWFVKLPDPLFDRDYSTIVLDDRGEILRVFLNSRDQWIFPPTEEQLPVKLITAVITFEDKRFFKHPGVDPISLGRAIIQNIRAGRVISGASTITMQVARLSRPKERTLKNKLVEMIQALKLELAYNKEEILKLYLNHAPYGSNIIGYRTASYRYFDKDPAELTWGQAATLAVLPNSPGLINPVSNSDKLKLKRDRLLKKLLEHGEIGKETYQLALKEPLPEEQIPFDLSAPHLTESLKLSSDSNSITVRTTISSYIQNRLRRIVDNYMKDVSQQGIKNCALLVAETKSGAVKAYIGSQDYFDNQNEGKINGVLTARSSGSILKPFLYGLAMDMGLIIPESRLKDLPIDYGAYTPYNYDGTFQGLVTVHDALINSLNAPAVALLAEYGVDDFYQFLNDSGITTLTRSPREYGLPLILGGAEVNLWEVVALYRGLGKAGNFSELHVLAGNREVADNKRKDNRLITGGASYLVLNILKDLKRPGVEGPWREYTSGREIAWKTGTSYGNRDAWAVGVTPELTIGVWLGNFDSSPSKGLTGLRAAAPLLFRVFGALQHEYNLTWFESPECELKKVKVSVSTGYPIREEFLRDAEVLPEMLTVERPCLAAPLKYSPYERAIFVNRAETEEVCSLCWDRNDLKKLAKPVYPPQVVTFLKSKGKKVYTIPPHKKGCPNKSQNPIEFIYPIEGSIIMIPRGITGDFEKVTVKVAHSQDGSKLFWYLDDSYLGETDGNHQLAIDFLNGWHRLYVVDQNGYEQEIKFYTEKSEK